MNVSIQDSHNLAWKMAYTILALAENDIKLLNTYEDERLPNARNLIDFDKFINAGGMTEEKLAIMIQFGTGCGIEYGEGFGISREGFLDKNWTSSDYLSGVLCPGRRLLNCKVKRFANGTIRDLHDEMRAEGRFSVILLAGDDFGTPGQSTKAAESVCSQVLGKSPRGLVQPIILVPNERAVFEWTDLPSCIKDEAEMSLFLAPEDVYSTYGTRSGGTAAGSLVVVRPDGVVGMIADLTGMELVVAFLDRFIKVV